MTRILKMKRWGMLLLVGMGLLFSAPQPGRAVVLDFNSGVESDPVGVFGIATFSNAIYASPGDPAVGFNRDSGPADTIATGVPSTFITEPVPIAGADPQGVSISFSTPVSGLQFDMLDLDWSPGSFDEKYTITLVNTANASFTFQGQASTIFPTGTMGDGSVLPFSFSQTNIVSVNILATVVASGHRAGIGVDNVGFSPVPEPSAALLVGGVLCGAALSRRKGRSGSQRQVGR